MTDFSTLNANFLWTKILQACSYCRKYTKCKISSQMFEVQDRNRTVKISHFFVLSSMKEVQRYNDKLSKISKGIHKTQKEMVKAVRRQYHKKPNMWVIK